MRRWAVGSVLAVGVLQGTGCSGDRQTVAGDGGTAASADGGGVGGVETGGSASAARGGKAASGGHAGSGTPSAGGGAAGEGEGEGGAAGNDAAGEGGATGLTIAKDLTRDITLTDLSVNLSALTATARITIVPSQSTSASFEIGDLTIESVERDGTALPWMDRGARLDVSVPAWADPLTLTIAYRFRVHANLDGFVQQNFTFTWPYYCGNLFPCHSDPADGTRFALDVTHAPVTLVYPRSIGFDVPSYTLAWISRSYEQADLGTTDAGTHISVRYQPIPQAENDALTGTQHLVAAFDWFEKAIGAYRFGTEVGPMSAPWFGGGMEHHPFWHVADDSMHDELTQIHEAAHGWFGNGVRLACWEDFVLSEGTASYLAARALEQVGASGTADEAWSGYESAVARGAGTPVNPWPEGCGQADILSNGQYGFASGGFTSYTYAAGALFLRAVEQKIGRPALDEALHTFYTTWVGRAARFQDLLDAVQASSGYDANACAKHWLRDTVPPTTTVCE
jgi:aminopeptidase N